MDSEFWWYQSLDFGKVICIIFNAVLKIGLDNELCHNWFR